ncbi:hypothetical protein LCGC14_2756970, partial [marine sediment metagenome]
MIDIRLLRADPDVFKAAAKVKYIDVDIDALLEVDGRLLSAQQALQELRTEQNAQGKKIAQLKGDDKAAAIEEMSRLKAQARQFNDQIAELKPTFDELMLLLSQPPAEDVPVGADDTDNVELRTEGEIRQFDFEPLDHVKLGEALDIIDLPRGVKLAGTRSYVLKGAGSL